MMAFAMKRMERVMRTPTNFSRGVTLTELLVVMLIIGLLSTVAVPVYINRMEDARIRLAQAETREIAHAEEQVALIHGFYVPFQVLDDVSFTAGITTNNDDSIGNELSPIYGINASIPPRQQISNQGQYQISLNAGSSRIVNMITNWAGPFLNPQRVYLGNDSRGPGDPNYPISLYFRRDFPLDPWGEPYRFYSPIGIIGGNALTRTQPYNDISFSNGLLTTNDDRNFERYAVVSWGRDSEPETLAGNPKDDIVYLFGSAGVESTFGLRN